MVIFINYNLAILPCATIYLVHPKQGTLFHVDAQKCPIYILTNPANPKKAKDIRPAVISPIGVPWNICGIFA